MRETGLLMKGPLVRKTLADEKTQTRRTRGLEGINRDPSSARFLGMKDGRAMFGHSIPEVPVPVGVRCPYGQPGDRLWVRETWAPPATVCPGDPPAFYRATDPEGSCRITKWRPSLLMPRWACRLVLELTDVCVERVQDIGPGDACAEGVEPMAWEEDAKADALSGVDGGPGYFTPRSYRAGFARVWDEINAKKGLGWELNPWVWRLAFRRVEG